MLVKSIRPFNIVRKRMKKRKKKKWVYLTPMLPKNYSAKRRAEIRAKEKEIFQSSY